MSPPTATPPTPTAEAEAESHWTGPFRLFDLPAELRLRIYEFTLAPSGSLSLTSTSNKRRAVIPAITPALLVTCRQVHDEASGILLEQNEVTITVNAHDTCWPTISEKRLSQVTLGKLEHMCVILDCTEYFNASYADVDFGPFEGLTSLKSLRIALVYRRNSPNQVLASLHIPQLLEFNVVAQILERIPATTKLLFATEPGTYQHATVLSIMEKKAVHRAGVYVEAPAADLEAAANGVPDLVRGCKSGVAPDVFADYHRINELYGVVDRGRVVAQV